MHHAFSAFVPVQLFLPNSNAVAHLFCSVSSSVGEYGTHGDEGGGDEGGVGVGGGGVGGGGVGGGGVGEGDGRLGDGGGGEGGVGEGESGSKPSSQQVFWHFGFFLRSLLHFFVHLFMVLGGFFLHFFFLIWHTSPSTKPSQLTLGGGVDGGRACSGDEGGADGEQRPQVNGHFASLPGW